MDALLHHMTLTRHPEHRHQAHTGLSSNAAAASYCATSGELFHLPEPWFSYRVNKETSRTSLRRSRWECSEIKRGGAWQWPTEVKVGWEQCAPAGRGM